MSSLKINNLSKTYPNGVKALDNISLEIPNGMFGLLGPNGAGKSSLMRTISSLQEADSGSIFLDDLDVFKNPTDLRKVLGYLPQEFGVYPHITAYQLLDHIATLKGISQKKERKELVDHLLEKVNLSEHKHKKVKGFSGGMKQRVGIAQALIGNPKLIIVDEPTAGLDPGERNRFHNLLASVGEKVIIILSTHIVDDVKELCSNMAIMNKGQLVYQGTPQKGIDELKGKVWRKVIERSQVTDYKSKYYVISDKLIAGNPLIHILDESNPENGFEPITPSIEDVFFSKIKRTNEAY
ncbi:ABC transporter ATP-binding protein [Aureispira sp. CCB-E]|uniref:ABC transporter ATP-binding protein n=1 Tax=Aureispira sp. CCB-E TaxID=3051121 RepID=UPI002868C13E|nr:ABC transporter ATP-binding protein [Aureispira sp. CCB-E]WMX12023.1 ABC transporter ATP-binding protein [Aureispira sp. CCB-E]